MIYRELGNTGLKVSEIALGSEVFVGKDQKSAIDIYNEALKQGINYFDLYNPEPEVRSNLGAAMKGRRDSFIIQGHICSAFLDGQYKRTRDISLVKSAFEDMLIRLDTDYIDVGMIHYVDEVDDYNQVFNGDVLQYAKHLKNQGIIKHIGISTHNPLVALMAAKTGYIEVIMFSINPAYDMLPPIDDVNKLFETDTFDSKELSNIDPERLNLYRYCEMNKIAITVMKPFAGGALLSESSSPFKTALTPIKCLHYCLTRPAVSCVMVGAGNIMELREACHYADATEEEREYASILAFAPSHQFKDQCMYCGHCAPCSVGIDIASVNKFYDLCVAQNTIPETVREHYGNLKHHAGECISCSKCEKNCPFGVEIINHMKYAKNLFGY